MCEQAFGAGSRRPIGDAVRMTDTTERPVSTSTDVVDEVRTWLEENWDPDLTVAQWWERLGLAGWSAPTLPENAYGRGLSRGDAVLVANTISEFGAMGAPGGLGLLLAAPTIATHGTPEQIERYVRDIVTGQRAWCQLFSEPGAGSDLAGLQAKAMLDGEEYIVNGQKVWTSGGHYADLGMLIARTNSDVPKHQGITYFALDMHQEGVDVRPLRELTGRALFNEVFMSDARVPADAMIGGLNNGWAVANTTLAHERAGLGSGGGSSSASAAIPGTVGGALWANAGAHESDIASILESARILSADGSEAVLPADELAFGYRDSRFKHRASGVAAELILDATFRLTTADPGTIKARLDDIRRWRQAHQPIGLPSAGSVFRNPPGDSAGRLIDAAGLKGLRIGGAVVSEKHANFIVNDQKGTAADVRNLAQRVRAEVAKRSGIELEFEIEFLGDWSAWAPS